MLNKIFNLSNDIVVGVDSKWKNRYLSRSDKDLSLAEY